MRSRRYNIRAIAWNLLFRVRVGAALFLMYWALLSGSSRAVAAGMWVGMQTLRRSSHHAPIRLIAFSKGVFNEDLLELFQLDDRFEILMLNRRLLRRLAAHFFGATINHTNYKKYSKSNPDKIIAYSRFVFSIVEWFRTRFGIQGVLSFNYGGADETEFGAACELQGVRFICLYKESLTSVGFDEFLVEYFPIDRAPFAGSLIITTSETSKRKLLAYNATEPENIEALGLARLDHMHRIRRESNCLTVPKGKLVFFYFNSVVQSRGVMGFEMEPIWEKLKRETIDVVIDVARTNPNFEIVVKVKMRDMAEATDLFGEAPDNVSLDFSTTAEQLIRSASVVCVFNSTTTLEAIAAGRKCIMPFFAEALREENAKYHLPVVTAVTTACSADDLKTKLQSYLSMEYAVVKELDPQAIAVLDGCLGNSDGKSGVRIKDRIIEHIGISN